MVGVRRGEVVSLAVAAWLCGCVDLRPFGCDDDLQCDAAPEGVCVEPGYCAFPDGMCPGGYRFDDSAAGALSGRCVEPPSASTGASDTTTAADTTIATDATSQGTSSSDGGTTLSVADSGGSSSSDDGSSSGSSTGASCGPGPCPCSTALAVGANHTCVARSDGSVVCWGRNNFGQLGTASAVPPFDDIPTEIAAPGASFDGVASYYDHACAGTNAGDVWCWGRNNASQAAPALGSAFSPVAPTSDSGALNSAALALGLQSTCSADAAGVLTCWGSNTYGQLAMAGAAPGPLISGPYVGAPLGYTAGHQHACTFSAAAVLCWGRNDYGQLAQPQMVDELETPTAVAVTVGVGVVAMAAGRHHTCAAVDGGNLVQCWGRNDCAQLDASGADCTQSNGPNAYEPVALMPPAAVVELRASQDHTCARTVDDRVYCWGGRQGWWLGTVIDNGVTVFPPAEVVVLAEVAEPLVEFGVGNQHACGRAASGRLWCWGSDQYEQLGFNDPDGRDRTVEMDLLCRR